MKYGSGSLTHLLGPMTSSGTLSPKRAAISCPQAPATLTRVPAAISTPFAVRRRKRAPSGSMVVTGAFSRISAPAPRAPPAKAGGGAGSAELQGGGPPRVAAADDRDVGAERLVHATTAIGMGLTGGWLRSGPMRSGGRFAMAESTRLGAGPQTRP